MNNPFAGGYNTNHYGRPNENKHAIQIEIKKSLYLDEHNRALNEHAKDFKKIITELIKSLNLDIEKIIKI
jgi:N-formylglutamate amidohydrolase